MTGFDLLVRGGTVVTPTGVTRADVGVRAGVMEAVGDLAGASAAEVLEADGLVVTPGGVDEHVHPTYLDRPGHVSTVGLHGGVTTLMHFAYAHPGESLLEQVGLLREESERDARTDFTIHGGMFDAERQVAEVPAVAATGVRTFKVFLAYAAQGWMTGDAALVTVMRTVRDAGGLLLVHCENGPAIDALERDAAAGLIAGTPAQLLGLTRPPALEAEAVTRAAAFAEAFGTNVLVVHVTSRLALEALTAARDRGAPVLGETCPQYLALTEAAVEAHGGLAKIGPPLRTDDDRAALWAGLADGRLQTVGSDHVPKKHVSEGGVPLADTGFGAPSLETMLPVLFSLGVGEDRLSLRRFVQVTSENPARAAGLYPRKGRIGVGADADLVLWDPAATTVLGPGHTHSGYGLYEGMSARGAIHAVVAGGAVAVREGEDTGRPAPGAGRFLATGPFDLLPGDRATAAAVAPALTPTTTP